MLWLPWPINLLSQDINVLREENDGTIEGGEMNCFSDQHEVALTMTLIFLLVNLCSVIKSFELFLICEKWCWIFEWISALLFYNLIGCFKYYHMENVLRRMECFPPFYKKIVPLFLKFDLCPFIPLMMFYSRLVFGLPDAAAAREYAH